MSRAPRRVDVEPGFVPMRLGSGVDHHCLLGAGGAMRCWGRNDAGQIGTGNVSVRQTTPVAVPLPAGIGFVTVSGGLGHTCATTSEGAVYCWGANDAGQLGIGSTASTRVPTRALTPSNVVFAHVALAGTSSCALTVAGEAYCWGNDTQGQLGNGPQPATNVPGLVSPP